MPTLLAFAASSRTWSRKHGPELTREAAGVKTLNLTLIFGPNAPSAARLHLPIALPHPRRAEVALVRGHQPRRRRAPSPSSARSLYLAPTDGGPVGLAPPTRSVSHVLDIPGTGVVKRNYSISSGSNDRFYRITVKREAAPSVPAGLASNWLHDQAAPGTRLRVAPPAGEFFLDQESRRPAVLLSGGVGLTPMVSMLEALVSSGRPTWFVFTAHAMVHGARNGRIPALTTPRRSLTFGGGTTTRLV
jgi:hypothetical protein